MNDYSHFAWIRPWTSKDAASCRAAYENLLLHLATSMFSTKSLVSVRLGHRRVHVVRRPGCTDKMRHQYGTGPNIHPCDQWRRREARTDIKVYGPRSIISSQPAPTKSIVHGSIQHGMLPVQQVSNSSESFRDSLRNANRQTMGSGIRPYETLLLLCIYPCFRGRKARWAAKGYISTKLLPRARPAIFLGTHFAAIIGMFLLMKNTFLAFLASPCRFLGSCLGPPSSLRPQPP